MSMDKVFGEIISEHFNMMLIGVTLVFTSIKLVYFFTPAQYLANLHNSFNFI